MLGLFVDRLLLSDFIAVVELFVLRDWANQGKNCTIVTRVVALLQSCVTSKYPRQSMDRRVKRGGDDIGQGAPRRIISGLLLELALLEIDELAVLLLVDLAGDFDGVADAQRGELGLGGVGKRD